MKVMNIHKPEPIIVFGYDYKTTTIENDAKRFYGFINSKNCSIKRIVKLEEKLQYYVMQYQSSIKLAKCIEGNLL